MLLGDQALLLVVGPLTQAAGFLIGSVWGGLALCTSLNMLFFFAHEQERKEPRLARLWGDLRVPHGTGRPSRH